MSEAPLSLTIQSDIRTLFDSSNGTVHKAMSDLEKILGRKIHPDPEWLALWNVLQRNTLNESTFVPTIARYAATWYESLLGRLENGAVGTDELLKVLAESRGSIVLKIQSSNPNGALTRPYTTWNSTLGSFHLVIPTDPNLSESRLTGILDRCFDALFSGQGQGQGQGSDSSLLPIHSSLPAEDGWADVDVAEEKEKEKENTPLVRASASENTSPRTEHLPTLESLSRPNELFKNISPRIMIVHDDLSYLTIQCSHQPSLELIQAYLTKWAKTDTSGNALQRPVFKCDLLESEFVSGLVDTLHIAPQQYGRRLNPTIVLAFIEGVLGYRINHTVHHKTGHTGWIYRRDDKC